MSKGILYLIPSPLGEVPLTDCVPTLNIYILNELQHFVVEEISTARKFLSRAGCKEKLDSLNFYTLNEHSDPNVVDKYIDLLLKGNNVGLISEAGLPAVADPGSILVERSHQHDIRVIPLVGPSSLMMALMASGLEGQSFAFNGYLPIKIEERKSRIKQLELISRKFKQSQIFIETPYRNDSLLATFLDVCSNKTKLTIAADITVQTEYIKTKTIAQWREANIKIGKKPCVFIIQS